MRNRAVLAIALVGSSLLVSTARGQNPYLPPGSTQNGNQATSRYELTPDAGPWLILAGVFKNERAREWAEAFAAYIEREHKVPAYIYEGNREERNAEDKRVQELRKQYDQFVQSMRTRDPNVVAQPFRVKTVKILPEFAVFVGHPRGIMTDMDTARKYLNDVRKFKAPPDQFCPQVIARPEKDGNNQPGDQFAKMNPFQTSFVAHNKTLPAPKPAEDDIYPILENLNSAEPLSVLKCSKPYTLVVRVYSGTPVVTDRNSKGNPLGKVENGPKGGDILTATALQARSMAEYLRNLKPRPYEAYVMHTQYYSMVCVGQYSKDDPELTATQNALRGLKLQSSEKGGVVDSLMPDPRVMQIPRPKK
jgi:hypothetical protein